MSYSLALYGVASITISNVSVSRRHRLLDCFSCEIGHLQLAIHMVQNRHAGEQKSLGQDKQKAYIILTGNFLCLSCPSTTFSLQHGNFVPREWLPAKGLFRLREHTSAPSDKTVDILACEQALHLKDVVKSHARG